MTPQQIMDGLADKNRRITDKNEEYKKLVEKYAQAKQAYNIAMAKKILELKADGQQTTLIPKLAAGDGLVASLCYDMDVAEGIMNACRESIKDIREAIGTYRSILTWQRAELTGQD